MRWAFAIWVLFCSQIAFAGTLDEARGLLEDGKFDAAIEIALAESTPEGLVLAAESLSTKVMLGYAERPNKSAKQARKWAEDAVEALPNSQEAQVQLALAYGFETRTSSPFRAWRKNLPKKTLEAIETVRANYPDDPRGEALLGAWHLGVVRKAGAKTGLKMFGATEDAGIKAYEIALSESPLDIVIASNYAVTLLGLDAEKYLPRASEIMAFIAAIPSRNAVEADIKNRILKIAGLTHDKEALRLAVEDMLDGAKKD
ncbi:MAG: hypothetical protein ACSHXY_05265 [Alphaproteobacteria bacterium]